MKKILTLVVLFLISLVFVACRGNDDKSSDSSNTPSSTISVEEQAVDAALEALTVETTVTDNFTLTTSGTGMVTIAWASDNAAIAINGQNATVTRGDADVTVTLTATATKGSVTKTKTFTVTVSKNEAVATMTIAAAKATAINSDVIVRGVVSGFHYSYYNNGLSVQGLYLTDSTATIYVFGYRVAGEVEKGQEIIISAKNTLYSGDTGTGYAGNRQFTSPELVQSVATGKDIPTEGAITGQTVSDVATTAINATNNLSSNTYIFDEVTIIKNAQYGNYSIEDASGKSLGLFAGGLRPDGFGSPEFAFLDEYLGKTVKLQYVVNGTNTTYDKWRGHVLNVIEVVSDTPVSGGGGGDTPVETVDIELADLMELRKGTENIVGNKYSTSGYLVCYDAGSYINYYLVVNQDDNTQTDGLLMYSNSSGSEYAEYKELAVAKTYVTAILECHDYQSSKFIYRLKLLSLEVVDAPEPVENPDLTAVTTAINAVTNPFEAEYETAPTTAVALPTSTVEGVTFTWESSDDTVISIEGGVVTITIPATGQVSVTITLTATKGEASREKTFKVLVGVMVVIENPVGQSLVDGMSAGDAFTAEGLVIAYVDAESSYLLAQNASGSVLITTFKVDNEAELEALTVGTKINITAAELITSTGGTVKGSLGVKITTYTKEEGVFDIPEITNVVTIDWETASNNLKDLKADHFGAYVILKNVQFDKAYTASSYGLTATGYAYFNSPATNFYRVGLYKVANSIDVKAETKYTIKAYLVGSNELGTAGKIIRFSGNVVITEQSEA